MSDRIFGMPLAAPAKTVASAPASGVPVLLTDTPLADAIRH